MITKYTFTRSLHFSELGDLGHGLNFITGQSIIICNQIN